MWQQAHLETPTESCDARSSLDRFHCRSSVTIRRRARHGAMLVSAWTRLTVIASIVVASTLVPQATLAQDGVGKGGAFAALELQATRLNEGFGAMLGLHAGWETRRELRIGGVFYDLLNGTPIAHQPRVGKTVRTKMHFGGLTLGKNFSLGPVGVGGGLLLGVGDVSSYRGEKNEDFDRSVYLIGHPTVVFRLPDLAHFRTEISAGYRLAIGVVDRGTETRHLGGPTIALTIALAKLWGG
jgi:hypothetical protein